jgi:hypothetical protein
MTQVAAAMKRLAKIRDDLAGVAELLAAAGAGTADDGQSAPLIDTARRELRYDGVAVALTLAQTRTAELLLQATEPVRLEVIDSYARPGEAETWTVAAAWQFLSRFRRRLRRHGLGELADGIKRAGYRAYVWSPVWRSTNSRKCQAHCRGLGGRLADVKTAKNSKPRSKGK